MNNKPG